MGNSAYEEALRLRAVQLGVHVEDLTDYQREEAKELIPKARANLRRQKVKTEAASAEPEASEPESEPEPEPEAASAEPEP